MTFRESERPKSAPDDSQAVVGDEGRALLTEGGELVVRTDGDLAASQDVVESVDITDREDVPVETYSDVAETRYLSGHLVSDQEEPFTLSVLWLGDDFEEVTRQEFENDTEYVIDRIFTKANNVTIALTDESGDGVGNIIDGTLNWR